MHFFYTVYAEFIQIMHGYAYHVQTSLSCLSLSNCWRMAYLFALVPGPHLQ